MFILEFPVICVNHLRLNLEDFHQITLENPGTGPGFLFFTVRIF